MLLGDNTHDGAVMLRPFRFGCQANSVVYTYIVDHIQVYTQFRTGADTRKCVSRRASVYR